MMRVDDSIFLDYLSGKDISGHWLFNQIEDCYLFSGVDNRNLEGYKQVYQSFMEVFKEFKPWNYKIIEQLFPYYKEILQNVTVLLSIGFQDPYDCVFFTYQEKQYICFDIARFHCYDLKERLKSVITKLVTHEFVHACAFVMYPEEDTFSYQEKINHLIFHEGLAHLLAYQENIYDIDLHVYQEYYDKAIKRLAKDYNERDVEKQKINLSEGTSGSYWEKYLCIIGKFYFYEHRDRLLNLYAEGAQNIVEKIL